MNVTSQMKVKILHRDDLRVTATGGATLQVRE
jgi:hypothetical protein